jgi:hypothetical protein
MKNITSSVMLLVLAATAAGTSASAQTGTSNRTATPEQRRQHITSVVNSTAQRPITVTSGHRDNSTAHQRGAIDIRSQDISSAARHREAANISRALGSNHTVVVEEVHKVNRGQQGPEAQVNTAYRSGVQGNVRTGPVKASATHTHIQPNRR